MKPLELGNPPGRAQLLDALARQPPRLDLAALAIARLVHEDFDDDAVLAALDGLAERVSRRLEASTASRLDALVAVLAGEEGFRGDDETYHAAANSSLPLVLSRRKGLPITLSVLYAEVGRRAGLSVHGIGLPGHFIAALDGVRFDPFGGGRRLSLDDCRRLASRVNVRWSDRYLEPVSAQTIAWRMVNNLKGASVQAGATEQALRAVDLLLAMRPDHPAELRLRASLLVDLGAFRAARDDLKRCLILSVDDADRAQLERALEAVGRKIGQLH